MNQMWTEHIQLVSLWTYSTCLHSAFTQKKVFIRENLFRIDPIFCSQLNEWPSIDRRESHRWVNCFRSACLLMALPLGRHSPEHYPREISLQFHMSFFPPQRGIPFSELRYQVDNFPQPHCSFNSVLDVIHVRPCHCSTLTTEAITVFVFPCWTNSCNSPSHKRADIQSKGHNDNSDHGITEPLRDATGNVRSLPSSQTSL